MKLENIKLGHSPLTDTIYLYRHGKDSGQALDKRKADEDVMAVIVDYMMHDAPNGASKIITMDGRRYKLTVTPEAHKQGENTR